MPKEEMLHCCSRGCSAKRAPAFLWAAHSLALASTLQRFASHSTGRRGMDRQAAQRSLPCFHRDLSKFDHEFYASALMVSTLIVGDQRFNGFQNWKVEQG
jgi:hypothetical protein